MGSLMVVSRQAQSAFLNHRPSVAESAFLNHRPFGG